MQGLDLFGADTRESAFVQYAHQLPMNSVSVAPHTHTIPHARYRLSVFRDMEWREPYELQSDPAEFNNL